MISNSLLVEIAHIIDQKIAKVVLNGNYEITEFTLKQVSETSAVLNYRVNAGTVGTITKIELKDAQNKVISTNNVNVPITTDTILVQSILVKEGV
jgi:hypothetical protein